MLKRRIGIEKNEYLPRYHFLSYLESTYSRSGVILSACGNNYENFEFTKLNRPIITSLVKTVLSTRKLIKSGTIYVVMSPAQIILPVLRVLTREPIILDAGWTLSESLKYRRKKKSKSLLFLKNFLIDYFAMHLATVVLLESEEQRNYVLRKFRISRKKSVRIFTGFNENLYSASEPTVPLELLRFKKNISAEIILFRGKYNSEAGLELIAEITKKLSDLNFVIASDRGVESLVFSQKTTVLTRNLSVGEIHWLYNNAKICLGQLSNSKRLVNTIPHKAFEAGFFGKPYVTVDGVAIRELFPLDSQAIFLDSLDINVVSSIIRKRLESPLELNAIGYACKDRYSKVASQAILFQEFNFLCKAFDFEN